MVEKRLLSETALEQDGSSEDTESAEKQGEETKVSQKAEGYLVDPPMDDQPGSEENGKEDFRKEGIASVENNDDSAIAENETAEEADTIIYTWQTLSTEELWEKLYQIAQYWVSCAASLYREAVFMGELIQAIPPAYRFGWYIMQANAVKDEDYNLYLHKVADAAKAYPVMKELCKNIIKKTDCDMNNHADI